MIKQPAQHHHSAHVRYSMFVLSAATQPFEAAGPTSNAPMSLLLLLLHDVLCVCVYAYMCTLINRQVPHGANGLSQERAYVTGLTAANLVIDKCGVGQKAVIADVEPDEIHIAALKQLDQSVRGAFDALGIKSPFL